MMFLLVLLLPLLAAGIVPLLKPRAATALSAAAFALPFFMILRALFSGDVVEYTLIDMGEPIGALTIYGDAIAHAFGLTICLISAIVGLYGLPYMEHRFKEMGRDVGAEFKKYSGLFTFYAASMLWLVYSGNLILLYIFLELTLIASFLLIYLYGYGDRKRVGILYFIWTNLAGVLALVGFLLIGLDNGSTTLGDVSVVSTAAWMLIFIGMIIKLPGIGPHIWLPWAHAEAPTPVSALLSPLTVGLAGFILLRIYSIDAGFIMDNMHAIFIYGVITSIYGGLSVLRQTDYKKLLAYSTVSQMGYILIALCLGPLGIIAVVIQYMSHAFGKSLLFMSAGGIIMTFDGLRDIRAMRGLHQNVPTIANAALLGFMNLGGILTLGMIGELLILAGVYQTFGLNLAAIGAVVFIFILSGWYSFYTMKRIFYGTPEREEKAALHPLTDTPLYLIGALSILFLFPPLGTALIDGLTAIIGGGF